MTRKLSMLLSAVCTTTLLTGCMAIPQSDYAKENRCDLRSERKTLEVVNAFEDSGMFWSFGGIALLPITGVVFGSYVALNNMYHAGEERIVCGSNPQDT